MSKSISKEEQDLLFKHDWKVNLNEDGIPYNVYKLDTDCQISGEYTSDFVQNKLEEIREEDSAPTLSFEQRLAMLEERGFQVLCESPLELLDPLGEIIIGECASFTVYNLTSKK